MWPRGVEPVFAEGGQSKSKAKPHQGVCPCGRGRVIGYYSISSHSVRQDHLPEDSQFGGYREIPFLLLGRLAVDRHYQGLGYGDVLILHAFATTMEAAEKVGIMGMVVDAKNENAASFYQGFGFKRLSSTKNRLVLPPSALAKLIHG